MGRERALDLSADGGAVAAGRGLRKRRSAAAGHAQTAVLDRISDSGRYFQHTHTERRQRQLSRHSSAGAGRVHDQARRNVVRNAGSYPAGHHCVWISDQARCAFLDLVFRADDLFPAKHDENSGLYGRSGDGIRKPQSGAGLAMPGRIRDVCLFGIVHGPAASARSAAQGGFQRSFDRRFGGNHATPPQRRRFCAFAGDDVDFPDEDGHDAGDRRNADRDPVDSLYRRHAVRDRRRPGFVPPLGAGDRGGDRAFWRPIDADRLAGGACGLHGFR
ncbi:MAG: hypothetical protein BWZ10_03196 [candidate division BRC1 bacterium ADurb.BinA364]|nr:MAG: hypothetical protein BWZ10_03196 [candidate division BRC1 bacterium ADurb.BinA364]